MLEDGPRGLNNEQSQDGAVGLEGEDEDLATFGIDWEEMDDEYLMEHHYEHNPPQFDNPFTSTPFTLSEVICTPPNCPFSAEGTHQLDLYLSQVVDLSSHSMLVRKAAWAQALQICTHLG